MHVKAWLTSPSRINDPPMGNRPQLSKTWVPLGVNLGHVVIAHCRRVQICMDARKISWGVQVELSRGVSNKHWSWDDVTEEKLDLLRGQNADAAYKVPSVMRPDKPRKAVAPDLSIW